MDGERSALNTLMAMQKMFRNGWAAETSFSRLAAGETVRGQEVDLHGLCSRTSFVKFDEVAQGHASCAFQFGLGGCFQIGAQNGVRIQLTNMIALVNPGHP